MASPKWEPAWEPRELRQFVQILADAGRLVRVKEATDWKFEIGRITRECRSPLLFENIKAYPGQRVFTSGLCDISSIALALGVEPETTRKTLISIAKKGRPNQSSRATSSVALCSITSLTLATSTS